MAPTVLLVGLPADAPDIPPARREEIKSKLDALSSLLDRELGKKGEAWEYAFTAPPTVEADIEKHLKGDKKWDIILIGNGVRGQAHLTVMFELLINKIIELSPQSKLAFNVEPSENLDVIRRVAKQYNL